ncbi:MAG: cytochrome C [Burkholderiales bacterium]|nr:cytochrome C [Burkholderiales bacterium]
MKKLAINKVSSVTVFTFTAVLLAACGGGSDSGTSTSEKSAATDPVAQEVATTTDGVADTPNVTAQVAATQPGALQPVPNQAGSVQTFRTAPIDPNNPFFRPFGNGRTCASCHQENQGWSLTPNRVRARFDASGGNDPLFRLVDGANSPKTDVTTLEKKRVAYSMLLTKGVIRVGLPIPSGAEFELARVGDPYGFASFTELSLFRRPLPSTNLKFNTTVMWDARETLTDANSNLCIAGGLPPLCFAPLNVSLMHQANSAVRGHAEAVRDLTAAEQQAIVDFETGLFTAQVFDNAAGNLTVNGARGGPIELSRTGFYFGINDLFAGDYRTGASFNPAVMTMFGAWRTVVPGPGVTPAMANARQAIARGEAIFNSRPINITGVPGLNDVARLQVVRGTCASCHNVPNAGTHGVPRLMNTGTAAGVRRTPDLPLYTLRNRTTGELIEITDPGQAMLTGRWSDIGRFKVPSLRGLESRSPYFHDGSANDLADVVRFYDRRFRVGFTPQEVADLTAFLRAL